MKSLRPLAVVAVSLIFILTPLTAKADEVTINLTPETTYVDTVVEVTAPTEYFIETFTGVRLEQSANGTVTQRAGWVDSWIQLRQGETVLRADDDSNHVNGVNEYASKITGTVSSGTYIIRATSYLNVIGYGNPTGTYVLSSNLINLPAPEPEPEPEPTEPTEPVVEPPVAPSLPQEPISPPIIPQEPPLVDDIVTEEPSIPVEEPPVVIEEPTTPVEEPITEPEVAPTEPEQPPVEEEVPPTVEEAVSDLIEAADGEAITAEDMEEAGLTYEDLPPETPVEVRTDENGNKVVVTAEVAAALQVLESPAKLISAIFNDPGQVITAIANIGADMSEEERTESEQIIIASVIAGQAAINAASIAANSATRIPSTPSTPAGGPMAGNDKPRAGRRKNS